MINIYKKHYFKRNIYHFSKENIEKIVSKIIDAFYSNNNEDGIINQINIDFSNIYEQIFDDTDISSFIADIKSQTIHKVVYNLCKVYIDNFISCDMKPSFLLPKISKYMNDRVTYIDYESIEILKDSCKEEIKDFIYETVKKQCTEQSYYTDSIFFIYENVLERFDKKINECMKYIDQCYEKLKVQKNEIVVENVKEIEQDSMKYTLSVKESVKEMTIEITCDEDLEREIPTDY